MRELIVAAAVAMLCTGCGAAVREQFGPTAFHHRDYPYQVTYADGPSRGLMSEDWRLDNFQMRDGQIRDYKDGDEYVYTAEFDTDDDGTVDARTELYQYDLLFEHRRHNGRIWIRTFPVSRDVGDKSLEVLAENYVERVSGSGMMVSRLDDVVLEERRYGTRTVDSASGQVAGAPAHRVTFDVVNLDQQEADPDTVPTRVRLYLIRPPFAWGWGAGSTAPLGASYAGDWPVIMIAGYANDATRFDGEAEEFEGLVGRIAFEQLGGTYAQGIEGFPAPSTAPADEAGEPEATAEPPDEGMPAPDVDAALEADGTAPAQDAAGDGAADDESSAPATNTE